VIGDPGLLELVGFGFDEVGACYPAELIADADFNAPVV